MKKCPFCGADIEDSARFCLYCMQSLTEKEQILLHQKKKPQWLRIIAAVAVSVAFSIILIIILSGKQVTPDNQILSEEQQNSTILPSQTDSSDTPPVTESLHNHNYSAKNTDAQYQKQKATCTTSAIFYYSCACGEKGSEAFSYGETANHTIVTEPGYAATCKTPGLTDSKYCSVCNAVLASQVKTPVISHTYDNDQDESCNVCNYIRVLNCSHAKTLKLAAVPPTCTAGGLSEGKKCSLCEEILTAQTALSPSGHIIVTEQSIAPTCTDTGKSEGKRCGTCNVVLVAQVTLDAKGHTEVIDPAIAATCTANGKSEGKHCAICNTVLVAQVTVTAIGHIEVIDPAVTATCTAEGKTEGKHCAICKTVFVEQVTVAAKDHTYYLQNTAKEYVKEEATCLSPATYYYSCICGKAGSNTFSDGIKGGHTLVTIPAKSPDCTNKGWTEGSECTVCKRYINEPMELLPLGHAFRLGDSAHTCLTCGESDNTYVVRSSELPILVNDTFRIDDCIYTVKPTYDNRQIKLIITYTNISSDTTNTGPILDLKNVEYRDPCQAETLLPGQSGTCLQCFYTWDWGGTYDLVFE